MLLNNSKYKYISAINVRNIKPVNHITLFLCKFLKCICVDNMDLFKAQWLSFLGRRMLCLQQY